MNETKKQKTLRILTLLLIVVLGLAIRLVDFDDPPLDFHPARQLHSALIARAVYLNHGGDLPDLGAEYEHEAIMRGVQELWIEPPVLEYLSAALYQVVGDADLRVPRACSIFFWLLGAIGLYRLCRRFFGTAGTMTAVAFFLFFPYGVFASRSFQPDPLMVALILWALEALCHWEAHPTLGGALLAGLLAGAAIFVKQVSVFPLGLAMLFFVLGARGFRGAVRSVQLWLVAVLSLLPVLIYNFWGYFVQGFLVQQYQDRFYWREIISPAFYVRWIRKIEQVFGLPLAIGALLGTTGLREKKYRLLWMGYFAGYLCYGWVLPHHIGTHDYYHLILFPLLAVGLGGLVDFVVARLRTLSSGKILSSLAVLVLLVGLNGWWLADSLLSLNRTDYRAWPALWQELTRELDPYDGQINTIGVMDDYGAGMIYWGLRTPMIWDANVERLEEGEAMTTIWETMQNREFLIVTDFEAYYQQPRLQRWLLQHAQVYRQTADYLIFDLRELK